MLFILTKKKIEVFGDIEYKVFDNFCNLSEFSETKNNQLILKDIRINKDWFGKEYDYLLEEVFVTLNIDLVISNRKCDKLKEICKFYKIPVVFV